MISNLYSQNTLESLDQIHIKNQKQVCNSQEFGLQKALCPKACDVGGQIGRAHVRTPVTEKSRMPSSA